MGKLHELPSDSAPSPIVQVAARGSRARARLRVSLLSAGGSRETPHSNLARGMSQSDTWP